MPLPLKIQRGFWDTPDYRQHFEAEYVNGAPVITPDGVTVEFHANQFDHAFSQGGGPSFARMRRMPWIRAVLVDPALPVYRNDKEGKIHRVQIAPEEGYVVVCRAYSRGRKLVFVTAYVVEDARRLQRMMDEYDPWDPADL